MWPWLVLRFKLQRERAADHTQVSDPAGLLTRTASRTLVSSHYHILEERQPPGGGRGELLLLPQPHSHRRLTCRDSSTEEPRNRQSPGKATPLGETGRLQLPLLNPTRDHPPPELASQAYSITQRTASLWR